MELLDVERFEIKQLAQDEAKFWAVKVLPVPFSPPEAQFPSAFENRMDVDTPVFSVKFKIV